MTKTEVLEKMEKSNWVDEKGNISIDEGSIKSVWGYNKNDAVTIFKVHYTIDPYFKTPCGDTEPSLTIFMENGIISFRLNVPLDSINYEDYIWLTKEEVKQTGKTIDVLMAEI